MTNAVYGFTNILLTAISEVQPTHLTVAFDLPKPTFRQAMFVGYKKSRVKPDDELITQIPRIKEVVRTLNIPIYEVEGFEADDVIGTLTKQAISENSENSEGRSVRKSENQKIRRSGPPAFRQSDSSGSPSSQSFPKDIQVVILTSDRDLMQLIRDDRVMVKLPPRGSKAKGQRPKDEGNTGASAHGLQPSSFILHPSDIWNEERFIEEWRFEPKLLPDYKALAGDQSDDIPGIKGIGEKTAKILVSSFGAIDDVYRQLIIKRPGLPLKGQALSQNIIKKLAEGQDGAQLSKKLATIDVEVPIKLDWKQTEIHQYDKQKILEVFDELQFKTLIKKLPNDSFEQSVQEVLF